MSSSFRSALRRALVALLFPCFALSARPSAAASSGGQTSYEALGRVLDRAVRGLDWSGGRISFAVVDLRYGIPVFEVGADDPHPPGQVLMLATALAALERLGPDFSFATEFAVEGDVVGKRLTGSIRVRGDGDPTMSAALFPDPEPAFAAMDRWAGLLRARGVRVVEGDLLVDAAAFDDVAYPSGWPLASAGSGRLPETSALNFNDNCADFRWLPGKKDGAIASYEIFPPVGDYLFVSNNVRLTGDGRPADRLFRREPDRRVIEATGRLAVGTEARDRASVPDPALFFGYAFRERLKLRGIRVEGEVREARPSSPKPATATPAPGSFSPAAPAAPAAPLPPPRLPGEAPPPAGANPSPPVGAAASPEIAPLAPASGGFFEVLDTHRSPPLSQIVRVMLRHDRALDAEVLVKTLGARATGAPGSTAAGTGEVLESLRGDGFPIAGLVALDGSGRSKLDRMTARQAIALLTKLYRHPMGRTVAEGFPVAGDPGALEGRFRIPAAQPAEPTDFSVPEAEVVGAKPAEIDNVAPAAPEGLAPEALPPVEMVPAWPEPKVAALSGTADGSLAMAGWALTQGDYPLHFALFVSGAKADPRALERSADALILELTRSRMR